MIWLYLLIGFILFIFILFLFLNKLSAKTYRPTKEQVKSIIERTLDDSIDYRTFDEFYCVKIVYDSNLEKVREKYGSIVSNPEYVDEKKSNDSIVPLTAEGKRELEQLIGSLDESTT